MCEEIHVCRQHISPLRRTTVGKKSLNSQIPTEDNQDLQYNEKDPPLILVSEEYLVSLDGEDGDTDGDIEPPRELRPEVRKHVDKLYCIYHEEHEH